LISDPGYKLVNAAKDKSIKVSPIPGPCALIAAISASGLPSNRFIFEGFLPAKSIARITKIQNISADSRTIIFYEAPHRILETLIDMIKVIGPSRKIVLARELTKTYETFISGTLGSVLEIIAKDLDQQKGEIVIVLSGADSLEKKAENQDSKRILSVLLEELPLKQAVSLGSKITGIQKNIFYKLALDLKK
jgi:16S rRNA (cytidine1402-2'-O)-methyltransferase